MSQVERGHSTRLSALEKNKMNGDIDLPGWELHLLLLAIRSRVVCGTEREELFTSVVVGVHVDDGNWWRQEVARSRRLRREVARSRRSRREIDGVAVAVVVVVVDVAGGRNFLDERTGIYGLRLWKSSLANHEKWMVLIGPHLLACIACVCWWIYVPSESGLVFTLFLLDQPRLCFWGKYSLNWLWWNSGL